jgi:hypothetical protein
MLNKTIAFCIISILVLLTSCGGGVNPSSPLGSTLKSIFNDAPTKGICYKSSPSGISGTTLSDGSFNFILGDTVTYWVQADGGLCTAVVPPATSSSAVLLGSVVPTNNDSRSIDQTFVLHLSSGKQAAEVLQALNHETSSIMDVGNVSILPSHVKALNDYINSGGATVPASTTIVQFFRDVQINSSSGGFPLVPVLPVTETFQSDVTNNVAITASSGILKAPATFSLSDKRLVLRVHSGVDTIGAVNSAFSNQYLLYFDGNGNGSRLDANLVSGVKVYTPKVFSYNTIGAVLSSSYFSKNENLSISYFDERIHFFNTTGTQFSNSTKSNVTSTWVSRGYQVNLEPVILINTGITVTSTPILDTSILSKSLVAGKELTLEFPMCAGVSTLSFSFDGLTAQSSCAGTLYVAGNATMPGVLFLTQAISMNGVSGVNNNPKDLYFALDYPVLKAGSSLVYFRINSGTTGGHLGMDTSIANSWGKMPIYNVKNL